MITIPEPSADDAGNIQAAINAADDGIFFPPGTYSVSKPLDLSGKSNFKICGARATIQSNLSDLFTASGSLSGLVFADFSATSRVGGGHIFNFDGCSVSQSEFRNLTLAQNNPAKSVLSCVAPSGGFIGNWLHHFSFSYVANTVPAINISGGTVNQVQIRAFRATGNAGSTAPAISLEQQNTSAGLCCEVSQGTFELPYGGAVLLLSMCYSSISHCAVYDTGAPAAPLFHVAKSAFSGAAPSASVSLDHVFSAPGTISNPDVYFEADVAGQGGFALAWSKINYLKGGVGGAGNAIALLNATVNNSVNATTTTLA